MQQLYPPSPTHAARQVTVKAAEGAVQLKDNRPASALRQKRLSKEAPAQLAQIEKMVTGTTHLVRMTGRSLYNKDYASNEVATANHGDKIVIDTNVRYRSRRGPNQEIHSGTDENGPKHYLWYRVLLFQGRPVGENVFIREDTFTHPAQESALAQPLSSNVYGTDKAENNEIADAYREGQRDFDCAWSYRHGQTYREFRSFSINKGPVRIVYKFKLAELAGAAREIGQLTRTPGVIVHTIMLHELPEKHLEKALDELALLGKTYQCHIGVSNVDITGLNLDTDLPNIHRQLARRGVKLSVIENKMNPGLPDKQVRAYCLRHGIQYLAYGLTGPSVAGGTCGLVPGAKDGEFKFLDEPHLKALSHQLNITPEQLRYVVYTWARSQSVSVVTRSSQAERRQQNATNVKVDRRLAEALDDLGDESKTYRPLVRYLLEAGVSRENVLALFDLIQPHWLRSYYKKAVIEFDDSALKNVMLHKFGALRDAPGKNDWRDLTAMREWLAELLVEKQEAAQNITAEALFAEAVSITLSEAPYTAIGSLSVLSALPNNTEIAVMIKSQGFYYKSNGNGTFQKV